MASVAVCVPAAAGYPAWLRRAARTDEAGTADVETADVETSGAARRDG